MDPEGIYVSPCYDKRSSARGMPPSGIAADNAGAREPGPGEDHPRFLTVERMKIGTLFIRDARLNGGRDPSLAPAVVTSRARST